MDDIVNYFHNDGLVCEFEPKKGYSDYPKMLEKIISFVNAKTK